jgi:hypothetical protein
VSDSLSAPSSGRGGWRNPYMRSASILCRCLRHGEAKCTRAAECAECACACMARVRAHYCLLRAHKPAWHVCFVDWV